MIHQPMLRRVGAVVDSLAGTDLLYTGEAGPASAACRARSASVRSGAMMRVSQPSAVTDWMVDANTADRLAGSYPYLTMLATATCGWLR